MKLTVVYVIMNGFTISKGGTRATSFKVAVFEGSMQRENLQKDLLFDILLVKIITIVTAIAERSI